MATLLLSSLTNKVMNNIFIFPKQKLRQSLTSLKKHPRFLILLGTIVLTYLFPELGITFKIDLFDLPVERLLPKFKQIFNPEPVPA